jgi:hypothetical protein
MNLIGTSMASANLGDQALTQFQVSATPHQKRFSWAAHVGCRAQAGAAMQPRPSGLVCLAELHSRSWGHGVAC